VTTAKTVRLREMAGSFWTNCVTVSLSIHCAVRALSVHGFTIPLFDSRHTYGITFALQLCKLSVGAWLRVRPSRSLSVGVWLRVRPSRSLSAGVWLRVRPSLSLSVGVWLRVRPSRSYRPTRRLEGTAVSLRLTVFRAWSLWVPQGGPVGSKVKQKPSSKHRSSWEAMTAAAT
jgi:hypothetical protein